MAIRLIDEYPTRVDPASEDYPHGKGRNKSAPDAVDGTPYDQKRFNDHEALFQALWEAAGITPDGTVDTVPDNQTMDALVTVANGFTEVDVAGDQDVTLDYNQSRVAGIRLTGALAGNIDVIVPDTARSYVVINETSGDFDITLTNSAGSGVAIPRAGVVALACDGTDILLPTNVEYARRQVDVDMAGGTDVTLTESDSTADLINLTGTLTADVALIVPDAARKYTIVNSTSGSFAVTVKTADGTGVSVIQGNATILRSDGTDVVSLSPVGAYSAKDIGEPFGIWDHLTGVEPPDNSGVAKFVRLTAGQDGSGGYNEGLLINETITGSGPTIEITAEIATGPLTGAVVNLLNSENRYLMPGENSGAVADDQMQQITGFLVTQISEEGSLASNVGGAFSQTSVSGNTGVPDGSTDQRVEFDSADSPDARTGDHTNVKHAQATYYMRVV